MADESPMFEIPSFSSRDAWERFRHVKPLARAGNPNAQFEMAGLYLAGQVNTPAHMAMGISLDFYQACRWLRAAAEQGHGEAQNSLGVRHNRGEGVEKDHVVANDWFEKAASNGSIAAVTNLAMNIERGLGTDQAPDLAASMYRRAIKSGDVLAHYRLADMILKNQIDNGDPKEAIELLLVGEKAEFVPAKMLLAYAYGNEIGTERDLPRAYSLLRQAAVVGNEEAATMLMDLSEKLNGMQLEVGERAFREWSESQEI